MYLRGEFINVVYLQGDGVKGCTKKNEDGSYTVFLNPDYTQEQQKETFYHELNHIFNGDLDSCNLDINRIEAISHRG